MSSRAKREPLSGQGVTSSRTPMSDADLDAFYRQAFQPLVRRATWKHHLSRDDARDIVQDAFVVAIPRIDSAGNPRAWLIQVVDHLAMNYQRKVARRAQLAERWNPGSDRPQTDVGIEKGEDH
jgi:DNA-directed RNA polymerase specialized sigma24 family protein